jgi:hypothetical protein
MNPAKFRTKVAGRRRVMIRYYAPASEAEGSILQLANNKKIRSVLCRTDFFVPQKIFGGFAAATPKGGGEKYSEKLVFQTF